MITIIIVYIISVVLACTTIDYMVDKGVDMSVGMFVIFCPLFNTFWIIYRWYKVIRGKKSIFYTESEKYFCRLKNFSYICNTKSPKGIWVILLSF